MLAGNNADTLSAAICHYFYQLRISFRESHRLGPLVFEDQPGKASVTLCLDEVWCAIQVKDGYNRRQASPATVKSNMNHREFFLSAFSVTSLSRQFLLLFSTIYVGCWAIYVRCGQNPTKPAGFRLYVKGPAPSYCVSMYSVRGYYGVHTSYNMQYGVRRTLGR